MLPSIANEDIEAIFFALNDNIDFQFLITVNIFLQNSEFFIRSLGFRPSWEFDELVVSILVERISLTSAMPFL